MVNKYKMLLEKWLEPELYLSFILLYINLYYTFVLFFYRYLEFLSKGSALEVVQVSFM